MKICIANGATVVELVIPDVTVLALAHLTDAIDADDLAMIECALQVNKQISPAAVCSALRGLRNVITCISQSIEAAVDSTTRDGTPEDRNEDDAQRNAYKNN